MAINNLEACNDIGLELPRNIFNQLDETLASQDIVKLSDCLSLIRSYDNKIEVRSYHLESTLYSDGTRRYDEQIIVYSFGADNQYRGYLYDGQDFAIHYENARVLEEVHFDHFVDLIWPELLIEINKYKEKSIQ